MSDLRPGEAAPAVSPLGSVIRQFSVYSGVGVLAAVAHYGVLIALVESRMTSPVPATLAGYVAGGLVSYGINRRLTFRSDRPHAEATWRFALVAGVGFCITALAMSLLIRWFGPTWYLPAQILTTGVVLVWGFAANRIWTFRPLAPP